MSESKSKDEMTGDELRKDALEKGFVLDDTLADHLIVPDEKKDQDQEHDGN
jgi:hypothetical protein